MSEKILSGACDDCPMRRKINCDDAEQVPSISYISTSGRALFFEVNSTDAVGNCSYEFSDDIDDPDNQRLELRSLQSKEFLARASAAVDSVIAKDEPEKKRRGIYVSGINRKVDIDIPKSMRNFESSTIAHMVRQASLKESLVHSINDCEGPQADESSFFLRRKKCGADIVGRVIPRSIVRNRNHVNRMLDQYKGAWWQPDEHLGKFKPIR